MILKRLNKNMICEIEGCVNREGIVEFMRSSRRISNIEILNQNAEVKEVNRDYVENVEDFRMIIIKGFEAKFEDFSVTLENISEMSIDFNDEFDRNEVNQKVDGIVKLVYSGELRKRKLKEN